VLAARLRTLTEDPGLALRMGQESARRISTWNFESDARGLLACLDAVVPDEGARAGRDGRRGRQRPASGRVSI